ncbi:MAG: LysR family transcriptional regulator [Lachnospiraceae bacterium]|nr:LysR family transcriptional regulator [Lachnospiraceae bacterium]
MNTRQLQLFVTIANLGSFSKAEKTEFMSKQAMLRQMNQLEDEVGEKLLLRNTAGITLTDAGKSFYEGARDILKLENDVFARCRDSSPTQDSIRISYVEHQVLLNDVTEAFAVKYPDIRIHRVVHPNHSGEYRVEHDIADVGETFYSELTAHSPLAYTKLADMPYLAAMTPKHPLSKQAVISIEDLAPYPIIVYEPMMKKEYLNELEQFHFLDVHRDVDAQVQAAFYCAETDTVLLTANHFVRTIPDLLTLPLMQDWSEEYGIIYRPNPTGIVRKYIDLAVAKYRAIG